MAIFPTFLLGNTGLKNEFYDFLEKKNAFLGYKNKKFKSRKIDLFPKGWFWLKKRHYSNFFFLSNIGQESDFYNILERENAFLGYKNKKFKKSKTWHFSTGVNSWFQSKNGHFSYFFFQAIQDRKMTFTIFQVEKTPFQTIKTRTSNSPKNDIFSKGLTDGFSLKMAISPTFFLANIFLENVFYNIVDRKNAILDYKNNKFKKPKN